MPSAAGKPSQNQPAQAAPASAQDLRPWRQTWHLPALVIGAVLLTSGLAATIMTAPKPDFDAMLRGAEAAIDDHRPSEALNQLNQTVLPYVERAGFTPKRRAHFHALRARALYLGAAAKNLDSDTIRKIITDEYNHALRRDPQLSSRDRMFLGRTLAQLGRYSAADEIAQAFEADQADRRRELSQAAIQLALDRDENDAAAWLIERLSTDADLSPDLRAWVESARADLMLAEANPAGAVEHLLRWLPRLASASADARGRVFHQLGAAYFDLGDIPSAITQLQRAEQLLTASDPLLARTVLMLARADEHQGDIESARSKYLEIDRRFSSTDEGLDAALGLALTEADLDNDEAAFAAFTMLIERIRSAAPAGQQNNLPPALRRRMADLAETIARLGQQRLARGNIDAALAFARIARDTNGLEHASDTVVQLVAVASKASADALWDRALGEAAGVADLAKVDPATREAIRRLYRAAAAHYKISADRSVLSSPESYSDALWEAADAFGRAGDHAQTVRTLQEFLAASPNDARRPEAEFRVAQADQARGQYAAAARRYETLIELARQPDRGQAVGPFAERSVVPLARCYALDDQPDNDQRAEALLTDAIDGSQGSPLSVAYREALIELGLLLARQGRFAQAVAKLDEAVRRYGDQDPMPEVRYKLADAARQDAAGIAQRIEQEAMPQDQRLTLAAERRDRLTLALAQFDSVITELDKLDPRRLTPLQRTQLRNAYFYRGDCAFELGDLQRAIDLHVTARNRFRDDPASLVAFVQVLSAHLQRGEIERARQTNAAAQAFLERIPDTAWDDPDLPMDRTQWERWLEGSERLLDMGRTSSAGTAAPSQP